MLTHLLALALAAAPAPQDSVRVSATLSDDSMAAGDVVQLEVTVETNGPRPEPIRIDALPAGLDIVGQGSGEVVTGFGPRRTLISTQNWTIQGLVPGTYTLPAVHIVINGRNYTTRSLSLVVLDAPIRPRRETSVDRVRLRGRLEPERVYVGQQVTFIAEAEFPRSLRQRQTRPATYQAPDPSGFWAQDLPDPIVIGLRTIGGELYDTQSFRRAYFPLLPGEQRFPPARLAFEYRVSLGLPPDSRELLSDTLPITVLPVPEEGRPPSFNGAVGRYSMRATLGSGQLRVGEATTLVVEVTGRGNVKALPAPTLTHPDGVEVFPPTESSEVETNSMNLGGTKRFEWVIVPGEPGRISLPPVEYTAFDPIEERFDVMRSDSIIMDVTGQRVEGVPGIDLRPIRGRPSDGTPAWVLSPAFALAQLVPLLFLFAAWRLVRDPGNSAQRKLADERAKRFAALRSQAVAADREFWGRLAEAIRHSAADTLGVHTLRTASVETLTGTLLSAGVPRAATNALADVLRSLDRIRYAPGEIAPVDAPALVDRAERILDDVAAALRRSPRGAAATAGIVLLLVLPHPAAAQSPFDQAVSAYRAADYEAAAAAFLDHVASHPEDADGWYDAGNALFRSGDTGRAVAAWIRATRLSPRHRDARANLQMVSPAALDYAPPIVSLTPRETALAFAGIWWIAVLLTAVRVRTRQPAGRVLLVSLAVAVVIAIGGLAGLDRPAIAISLGEATVRIDPALKGEALERVPAGWPMEVVEERAGWIRVRTALGIEGWVDLTLVDSV